MTSSEIILSYKDSLLRRSDIELLTGPHWLNDSIIGFYFEYLQHEIFKKESSLLFVSPEVTQCIKLSPSAEVSIFLDPLIANGDKKFIFFALNDNEAVSKCGGTHWSLLVLSLPEGCFFHFDSSNGTNFFQGIEFSQKILRYFGLHKQGKCDQMQCVQQNNGYDCGVHVLCNAEQVAGYASSHGRVDGCPSISREKVHGKRKEIMDIIRKMKFKA